MDNTKMTNKELKEKINNEDYSFLNEYPLKDRTMLLVPGGSYGYGTNVDYINPETGERYVSDFDLRGVFAESPREILGLSTLDQVEDKATDTTIYSFRKIVNLLLKCNPNTIEILGHSPERIIYISEEGKMLMDNVDLFLTSNAIYSFTSYATAQLRRLENALARDSYNKTDKEKHTLKCLQTNLLHLKEHYQNFSEDEIKLYTAEAINNGLDEEIFLDINISHYPLRDFRNIFSEMTATLRNFGELNHRNRKKDIIHLNKHASHLVRLHLMLLDILEGKGINTYRENDKELLLDIRFGKIPYEEVFNMVNEYEKKIDYAKKYSNLPEKPDYNKVEEFVMEVNKRILKKGY